MRLDHGLIDSFPDSTQSMDIPIPAFCCGVEEFGTYKMGERRDEESILRALRPHLIDFMFHGSGGSDFCSLQKKKWARSCACVRAPICVVVMQLCSRKKINDIHNDIILCFFIYLPPGSQFSLGNP